MRGDVRTPMKNALIIASILLAACSGGGSSSTPVEAPSPEPISSVFVLGDSLCNDADEWPKRLSDSSGVLVEKYCVAGLGIASAALGQPLTTEQVSDLHHGEYDVFIIALGVNDFEISNADFARAYRNAYNTHMNTACLLPPLTQRPDRQPRIEELRRIIIDICGDPIESPASDHEDGLHYTAAAQEMTMERVRQALGIPYSNS